MNTNADKHNTDAESDQEELELGVSQSVQEGNKDQQKAEQGAPSTTDASPPVTTKPLRWNQGWSFDRKLSIFDGIGASIGIAALILLIIQSCELVKTNRIADESLRLAKKSFEDSQRSGEESANRAERTLQAFQDMANAAKSQDEITKQSRTPVVQIGGWDLKPDIAADKALTASITLTNHGSVDITNAINYIFIESRKDEPPENYQPKWKTVDNVTLQRGFGSRTFVVSANFPQSEVEQIQADRRFICVFGFLDYPNQSGERTRKRFCVKFGPTTRECETWQNQENIPN